MCFILSFFPEDIPDIYGRSIDWKIQPTTMLILPHTIVINNCASVSI